MGKPTASQKRAKAEGDVPAPRDVPPPEMGVWITGFEVGQITMPTGKVQPLMIIESGDLKVKCILPDLESAQILAEALMSASVISDVERPPVERVGHLVVAHGADDVAQAAAAAEAIKGGKKS